MKRGEVHERAITVTRNECLRGTGDRYRGNWKDFLTINFSPSKAPPNLQLEILVSRISKRLPRDPIKRLKFFISLSI